MAGNNYPDSPCSQGGMKFATQISPLLNSVLSKLYGCYKVKVHTLAFYNHLGIMYFHTLNILVKSFFYIVHRNSLSHSGSTFCWVDVNISTFVILRNPVTNLITDFIYLNNLTNDPIILNLWYFLLLLMFMSFSMVEN